MAKRIVAYLLFVLGFLITTFFRNYTGSVIPYPFLIWVIGMTFFFGGWLLIRTTPTTKEKKDNEQKAQRISALKANGEKIKIDFENCEVKENNFLEEKEKDNLGNYSSTSSPQNDYDVVDALTQRGKKLVTVQTNQSVVVYKQIKNGKTEMFRSPVLSYERTTLLFKLDMHKETILYVDTLNRNNYYFDLEFLER
jgi:hypothetical protein